MPDLSIVDSQPLPAGPALSIVKSESLDSAASRFSSKMVEGSGILSTAKAAYDDPIGFLKNITGADKAQAAVKAFEDGDARAGAVKLLQYIRNDPATRIAGQLIDTSKDQFKKAHLAFQKGDYGLVFSHVGGGLLPILSPLADSADLAKEGDTAGAAGLVAGNAFDFILPAAASKAGKLVLAAPAKIAELATGPGMGKIAGGAAQATAGVGAVATGSPVGAVYGAGSVVKGAAKIAEGLAERRAAATATPAPRLPSGVAYPGAQDPAAVAPRTPVIDTSTELPGRPPALPPEAQPPVAAGPPPQPTVYPGAQDPAAVQPRTPQIDTSTELTQEQLAEIEARRARLPAPASPGVQPPNGAPPAPVPAAEVSPLILDEIANGLAGKNFKKLPPAGQATVRRIALQMQERASLVQPTQPPPPQPASAAQDPASTQRAVIDEQGQPVMRIGTEAPEGVIPETIARPPAEREPYPPLGPLPSAEEEAAAASEQPPGPGVYRNGARIAETPAGPQPETIAPTTRPFVASAPNGGQPAAPSPPVNEGGKGNSITRDFPDLDLPSHLSELPEHYKEAVSSHPAMPSAVASDVAMAKFLESKGITKSKFSASTLEQKNAWRNEAGAQRGVKPRPWKANDPMTGDSITRLLYLLK